MVGAAVLISASAASVSAQDYTWTLQNFRFGDYFDGFPGGGAFQGVEEATIASGSMVISRTETGFEVTSYSFNTTADLLLEANLAAIAFGTGFAGTYSGPPPTPVSDDLGSYVEFQGVATDPESESEFSFRLSWSNGELVDAMNFNAGAGDLGAALALEGSQSYEYDLNGTYTRYNQANQSLSALPVATITLSAVTQVTTPEPASLALLGTGLLGIFAARRRKAA